MKEELFFTSDAALIDRLGRELVGKQETALVELVKNCYDADATEVNVTFEQDRLIIDDDGTGMDRGELISGFLRLASTLKVTQPVSQRFGRQRAGRKGIGRFATQRLGTRLALRTWTDANTKGLELTINWSNFERGLALEKIPVWLDEIEPRKPGTRIEISDLRDEWTESQIRRCWRGVFNLQQPFPVAPVEDKPRQDPGFEVNFYRKGGIFSDPELIANFETEILSHMHAIVELHVDDKGAADWRLTHNKFGDDVGWTRVRHDEPEESAPSPYAHLRSVWMKAYYAILEPNEFSPMVYTRVRELLRTEGGIRLYRNGFRVIPYGEPGDDWLQLDELYARRTILFPIANRNWFGVIELNDAEGNVFEEHTSREGLIETPAFQELRDVASSVLISAARKIAEQRTRKTRAGGRTEPTEFFLQRLRDAARRAREGRDDAEGSHQTDSGSKSETAKLLGEAETIIESVKAEFADEAAMLRLLATLGLTAAEFSHETGMTFQAVRLDFREIFDVALEARQGNNDFASLVDRARGMVDRLDALTSYLNELASARSARELAPVSVSRSVEEFARGMSQLAARGETNLSFETPPLEGLYAKPMHRAEVASILLNFYSNSMKAMKRTKGKRRILVQAANEDDEIVIRFSDTGDGIPQEDRERIFDLFYTTRAASPSSASTLEESIGTGLGLWIVRQIVSRAEGEVGVVDPIDGYSTTFEVRLPVNDEE